MFISVLDLFKIGIGPSSSHTMGPMLAANQFVSRITACSELRSVPDELHLQCILKGSLAHTGKGHGTDRAVLLGLNGFTPKELAAQDVETLVTELHKRTHIDVPGGCSIEFIPGSDIVFDCNETLPEHPNGLVFNLLHKHALILSQTYFSIGGGFISTLEEIHKLKAPLKMESVSSFPHGFDSARSMLSMADECGLTIAEMKRQNELSQISNRDLNDGLDAIWTAMQTCVQQGLAAHGNLPGSLHLPRRANALVVQLRQDPESSNVDEWLCAYAMAVSEENAAGHMVVTAPTNGAAGVIPAVLYYSVKHQGIGEQKIREFLLTAAAIGGIIKFRSSISGAEVGCQGEVGSASAMAAAGLCAVRGGSAQQIENAAEIALEHHLGMTCDPVGGLVQVPCIERNGFGAVKAFTAASLSIRGSGKHFISLDKCIAAMKQTGLEMSEKYKETSLGGLAVSITEC